MGHPLGKKLAEEGAQIALFNQDNIVNDWSTKAWELALDFCALFRDEIFSAEDLRRYCERRGLPSPKEPRAWGAIILSLHRKEIIAKHGYGESENPQAHNRPVTKWSVMRDAVP